LAVLYGSFTLREERRLRVYENRVLRRIFRPKRDEGTRERKKLHNEELNDLYSSPNIFRAIKSRRVRWTRHEARTEKRRSVYRIWSGRLRDRDHMEDPGVDRRIILRWIFRKWVVGIWNGSSWLKMSDTCECRNESSDSIKCRESIH